MINKYKNVNLQLTISIKNYEKLLKIQEQMNDLLNFNLTKSQIVEYLIRTFELHKPKGNTKTDSQKTRERELISAQVKALKDKLNVSYPKLEQITGISANTLKKYGSGTQAPTNQNKELLEKALNKYNIKI